MREDVLEKIESAYPKGFVLLYITKSGDLKVFKNNPHDFSLINDYTSVLCHYSDAMEEERNGLNPDDLGGDF